MGKRLFVALLPSDDVTSAITAWQNRQQYTGIRWVPSRNLHVTIIPPWHADSVDLYAKKLGCYAPKVKRGLTLTDISLGPDPRKPRLIWASGGARPDIGTLQTSLAELLDVPYDARPFKLHVTVARLRGDVQCGQFGNLPETVQWSGAIRSIAILESTLLPGGAEYNIIASLPLDQSV